MFLVANLNICESRRVKSRGATRLFVFRRMSRRGDAGEKTLRDIREIDPADMPSFVARKLDQLPITFKVTTRQDIP